MEADRASRVPSAHHQSPVPPPPLLLPRAWAWAWAWACRRAAAVRAWPLEHNAHIEPRYDIHGLVLITLPPVNSISLDLVRPTSNAMRHSGCRRALGAGTAANQWDAPRRFRSRLALGATRTAGERDPRRCGKHPGASNMPIPGCNTCSNGHRARPLRPTRPPSGAGHSTGAWVAHIAVLTLLPSPCRGADARAALHSPWSTIEAVEVVDGRGHTSRSAHILVLALMVAAAASDARENGRGGKRRARPEREDEEGKQCANRRPAEGGR
ncbi:hypothetical protein BC628DRAFT_596848 [Trametes gibbosa]|nr:hypothetical protein BC628DRAFT_596848 [Trametes gibbosa]